MFSLDDEPCRASQEFIAVRQISMRSYFTT